MKGPDMQTSLEVKGLLTAPQTTAANDEFARAREPQASSPGGWDPFEVWRTRVKASQDSAKPTNSIP
jgi:hypothetical protein